MRRLGTALAAVAVVVTVAGCGGGDGSSSDASSSTASSASPEPSESSASSEPSESADSGGAERPSVEELAAALERDGNGITAKQAECAAQVLDESDFSDETLASLAAGDETIEGMASKEDIAALNTAGPAIVACYDLTD